MMSVVAHFFCTLPLSLLARKNANAIVPHEKNHIIIVANISASVGRATASTIEVKQDAPGLRCRRPPFRSHGAGIEEFA
jgi:hypothetical protein